MTVASTVIKRVRWKKVNMRVSHVVFTVLGASSYTSVLPKIAL